jgi:hypothetical protein
MEINIISFDVGVKNIAFCHAVVTDFQTIKIVEWDCVNMY